MKANLGNISPEIKEVVAQIRIIYVELMILFPEGKKGFQKKGSFLKLEPNINIDYERLQIKKAHYLSKE